MIVKCLRWLLIQEASIDHNISHVRLECMIDVFHQFVECDKTDSWELTFASHICQEKEHVYYYYYSIITTPCILRNSIPVHYYNVQKQILIYCIDE